MAKQACQNECVAADIRGKLDGLHEDVKKISGHVNALDTAIRGDLRPNGKGILQRLGNAERQLRNTTKTRAVLLSAAIGAGFAVVAQFVLRVVSKGD